MGKPPETKSENVPSQVKALAKVKIAQVNQQLEQKYIVYYIWLVHFVFGGSNVGCV